MLQELQSEFRKWNTSQIIAGGFAVLILIGTLLLWMPFCTAAGESTSFTDAFFTATTCVCVTGLVTVSTAAHWTVIGKLVILLLIQFGGIGVISLASIIFITFHRRISMRNRRLIQESYNMDTANGMVSLVKRVALCVFAAETIGAACYAFCFVPRFGLAQGLAQSVFTAVSAFCNAGIDILGEDSLASFAADPLVNITTMGLIIASGLGFTVWWDVGDKIKRIFQKKLSVRRAFRTLHLQSQIVFATTAFLLAAGTVLLFFFERENPRTIGEMPLGQQVMAAAFQSVTTRTAGFFTVNQAGLSNASVMLCLFLMFVGGSPMGTAGGVKTTTLAVLMLGVFSNLRGKKDIEFCSRKIRESYIRSAAVVTALGLLVLLTSCVALAAAMPGENLLDILYELTSAVGTVGLSRGLTPVLTKTGKWIVILTMYLGRIGPITMGTAVLLRESRRMVGSHLAEEDLMIG